MGSYTKRGRLIFPTRLTKMQMMMRDRKISLKKVHESTLIAYPTLANIVSGRKVERDSFRKRTIIDLEKFFKCPAENFLGFANEKGKKYCKHCGHLMN